jgi:hypothetical protein
MSMKSAVVALLAPLIIPGSTMAAGLPWKFDHPDMKGGEGTSAFTLTDLLKIWDKGDRGQRMAAGMYLAGARDMLHWSNIDLRTDNKPALVCPPNCARVPDADALVAMVRPYVRALGNRPADLVLLYAFKRQYTCADFKTNELRMGWV